MRVLLQATTRAGGDLNPMVALARGLRDWGAEIVVLADPPAVPLFERLGMAAQVSGPEWEVGPYVKQGLQASAGQPHEQRLAAVQEQVAVWQAGLAHEARQLIEKMRPDVVVTSFFGTCIGNLLRAESSVPWCALNSTFYIGPNPPRPLERDFSGRAADVFRYSVIPYLDTASLVLHATDALFDYDHRGMPEHHYYTGPLIWEAPATVPDYVYEPRAEFLLVTLSSLKQDDVPIARNALAAMGHTDCKLIVTVGHGHEVEEVGAIPPNAHVEHYVPHSPVLERGQMLIAHAGHGSVMKAMWYGVPMVLVPWGRDQFGVAARAEHLGVAHVLPKEQLSVRAMADAIDRVLSEPSYKQAALAAARRLRDDQPIEAAVELVVECGGGTRSTLAARFVE